jgi:predicted SprT family Zn-dependent metalloprotease
MTVDASPIINGAIYFCDECRQTTARSDLRRHPRTRKLNICKWCEAKLKVKYGMISQANIYKPKGN